MKSFCSRQSCCQRLSCWSYLRSSFCALNVKVILLTEKMVKVIWLVKVTWPVKDWQTSPLVRCSFPSCKTSFCSPHSPSHIVRTQPRHRETQVADWQSSTNPPPHRLQLPQCHSRPDPASSRDRFLILVHYPPPRFELLRLVELPDFSQMLPRSYFWPLSVEDWQS